MERDLERERNVEIRGRALAWFTAGLPVGFVLLLDSWTEQIRTTGVYLDVYLAILEETGQLCCLAWLNGTFYLVAALNDDVLWEKRPRTVAEVRRARKNAST